MKCKKCARNVKSKTAWLATRVLHIAQIVNRAILLIKENVGSFVQNHYK